MTRPSWDQYWLSLLPLLARRSTCLRRQAAAIITMDNFIVSTGYNGPPRGFEPCDETEEGCLRDHYGIESGTRQEVCRAVHAEQNAIIQAARRGGGIDGGTMYCSIQPCIMCARQIINAGIKRVLYLETYPDTMGIDMFHEYGLAEYGQVELERRT